MQHPTPPSIRTNAYIQAYKSAQLHISPFIEDFRNDVLFILFCHYHKRLPYALHSTVCSINVVAMPGHGAVLHHC